MMKQNLRFIFMTLLCAVCSMAWGENFSGHLQFGTNLVKINKPSVIAEDDLGNIWTIATDGTDSFTANADYYQVGSSKNPATSITFTTTLENEVNLNHFEAKFGGFSGTQGNITLKVGDKTVATASLNGSQDIVTYTDNNWTAQGKTLTVTVSDIDKGVKCYFINYTYNASSEPTITVNPAESNLSSAGSSGTIPVSYYDVDKDLAEVVFCAADGTPTENEPDWILVGIDNGNIVYETSPNIGEARTAYLKVYGLDPEANDVYSDLITITQVAPATLTITPNEKVDIFVFDNADPSETIENGSGVPAGTTVLLSLDVHHDYEFKSLSVISEDNTTIDLTENLEDHSFTFTMPQSNVTVSCLVYPKNLVKSKKFVKITSQDQLTSGTYLIVYEAGNLAFNGGLQSLDVSGNSVDVTIKDHEIARTATTDAATFTYDALAKTLRSASGYYIGQTGDVNGLASSNNNSYENEITINDGYADITSSGTHLRYNSASNQTRFRYYKSSTYTAQAAVQLYKLVDIEAIDVPITSVGYSSLYYCTLNLKVPAGVTAYTYKANGEKMVVSKTYGTNDVIPAGTGVVLKGDEGTYTFNITSESGIGDEDNALLGLDVEGTTVAPANSNGEYYFYKLSTDSNGDANSVGFWWGEQNGGAFTLPAHKAYLAIKQSEGGSTPVSSFIFDETVGISSVAAQVNHADGVYTLSGVRVNGDNLPKGIYIMNGKKVVIK